MEDLKKLKNRIDWICRNKVNAFSPTISPAPKAPERNEIESIDKAVRYFYDKGVQEIVVQKKYMGSYCDIYLHRNLDETYFVSRNGYTIDFIDLDAAREACRELHGRLDWSKMEIVIIQSELMPWSVLGRGLIDNEFIAYINVHRNHYEHLAQSDLYTKIAEVKESPAYKEYLTDKETLSNKELRTKYPHHILRQYDSLTAFVVHDMNVYRGSIETFEQQIEHFGRAGEIYFKPFNILKKIFHDGTEEFINDNMSYAEVNDDEFLHFFIRDEGELDQSIDEIYAWFATLEKNLEEGILVKPRQAFIKGLPPAFKIRNNQYLTMIYGLDFRSLYKNYLNKRNISRKLECSINDWMLNRELLHVRYAEIDTENYFFKNLVYDRIMGENIESTLDKRL